MGNESNTSKGSFRYSLVFGLAVLVYVVVLLIIAYPAAKKRLEENRVAEHLELWNDSGFSFQTTTFTTVLYSHSGLKTVERSINPGTKDQLHLVLEVLLQNLSEEELAKGYYSLIPSGTKLIGASQNDGYFFVSLSEDFLKSDDKEGAARQIKETLGLYYETESLSVICGEYCFTI